MIDRIIAYSLAHRRLVVALALVLVVAGLVAMRHTPIDAIPDLSENQVLVYTPWAGHNPQEIEDQVTTPISAFLQGVPGATTVRGSSEIGFSLVSVIFNERVGIARARRGSAGLPPRP